MQTPHTRANSRNRHSKLLAFVLVIVMLIMVSVLSLCFMKAPQSYSSTEGDAGKAGINVNTQDHAIDTMVLEDLPEFNFGGGLIAILLCIGALGLFVKYKR